MWQIILNSEISDSDKLNHSPDVLQCEYLFFNIASIFVPHFDSKTDIISKLLELPVLNSLTLSSTSHGSIDVNGNVYLDNKRLTKLPLKFNKVTGNFNCSYNQLTTLEGSPREVGGDFYCGNNELTTLEGSPREVGGYFSCRNNELTTLEGSPREVGGDFYCHRNQLTTLEGGPREVGGDFYCHSNQLTTLEGSPRIGGNFGCNDNPIYSVYQLFPDHKTFMDSLDYSYLRGTNIVKSRFQEALDELGIKMPNKINGYRYI